MKKLLSLVALLALAAAFVPHEATAGLRGAFDPITTGPNVANGIPNGMQTPAIRPGRFISNGGATVNEYLTFTTRSQVVGFETSREIWQTYNMSQVGFLFDTPDQTRLPLLRDETGHISYTDPAWSPNGLYLAYVKTDKTALQSEIWVQKFALGADLASSVVPDGSPILVVSLTPGIANRHPAWSPDGLDLAFDSNKSGLSADLYRVHVFDSYDANGVGAANVGSPVRLTFVDNRAELDPSWSPDGTRLAFSTNQFGPNVIEILDLSTLGTSLAETNFKTVTHNHPRWANDGSNSIYYDAPENEDQQQNPDIWRLDMTTQSKCDILFDGNGDVNVDVTARKNLTKDGVPYNSLYFESQAAGFGLIIWRANYVQACVPPLAMGIDISPTTINLDANGNDVNVTLSFPAETQAAGYQAVSFNGPLEGIRMRTTILRSPLMLGIRPKIDPRLGSPFPEFTDHSTNSTTVTWVRRELVARLVALGLVNQNIIADVTAYSNNTGRGFKGFGVIRLATASLAGSAVKLEQNSPNPFNPVTKIRFASSKAGNVSLRIYNVRGELVKTLANRNFEAGAHEITWDGRNSAGQQTSSGVYYAKVSAAGGNTDVIKMVMAK